MAVKAQGDVLDGMQRVYRRFERWRSSHRGRLPIPAGLGFRGGGSAGARCVPNRQGFAPGVCQAQADGGIRPGSAQTTATPATFLELMPSQAVALSECLIELEGPRGKIRIQWKGAAAPDLAALSRTLWESA